MKFVINGWVLMFIYILIGFGLSFLLPNEKIETKYIENKVLKPVYIGPEYQTFEVTAYTPNFESTGKTEDHPLYKVTASGQLAWENITLACPPSMAFGTKIYFRGIDNVYTCTDRGSAITEGHLDIYMEDLDRALYFGRQKLEVLIIP